MGRTYILVGFMMMINIPLSYSFFDSNFFFLTITIYFIFFYLLGYRGVQRYKLEYDTIDYYLTYVFLRENARDTDIK